MHNVFLGTGGNIGNKHKNFDEVVKIINKELGEIIRSSSVYETPPWGFESENPFWNQVLLIKTEYSPTELLDQIEKIENRFGRIREKGKYSSRKMDIDILFFDEEIINTETLTIPHPLLQKRLFVLVPLAEIAPDFVHPVLKKTSVEMLNNCEDKSEIIMVQN